jgi:PIN domain nuclease of toxin-antitoxin system
MADQLILLDTSILIDYYRKSDKSNSVWIALIGQEYEFAVSAISKYEIPTSRGSPSTHEYWGFHVTIKKQ